MNTNSNLNINETLNFINDMMNTINAKSEISNIDGKAYVTYDFASLTSVERKVVSAYDALLTANTVSEIENSEAYHSAIAEAKRRISDLSLYLMGCRMVHEAYLERA